MSLLDAWPEQKAAYARLIATSTRGAGGMIGNTFTTQATPIVGILLAASRGVLRLVEGTTETVTHVFYTTSLIVSGDKIQNIDGKTYAVGKVTTHCDEYVEAWLNELL